MELCHACFEWHVRKVRDHKPMYEPMSRSVARTHVEFSLFFVVNTLWVGFICLNEY